MRRLSRAAGNRWLRACSNPEFTAVTDGIASSSANAVDAPLRCGCSLAACREMRDGLSMAGGS